MKYIIAFLFLFVFFIQCTDNQTKTEHSDKSQDSIKFYSYYSKLNIYKVPFELFCGLDANTKYQKAPSQNYFSYDKETPLVVAGRLYVDNEFITILYGNVGDDLYPLLYTYNYYGDKIDSLNLAGDCSGEEGYLSSTNVKFNFNNNIIKVDSISRYEENNLGEIIPGTNTTTIYNYLYLINEEGYFSRKDSSLKVIYK
jgi:hypothetical protein